MSKKAIENKTDEKKTYNRIIYDEQRFEEMVSENSSIEAIAAELNLNKHFVRTHVKDILARKANNYYPGLFDTSSRSVMPKVNKHGGIAISPNFLSSIGFEVTPKQKLQFKLEDNNLVITAL